MKAYQESIEALLSQVESSEAGLTKAQAQQRLAEKGHNQLEEAKKATLMQRFIKQLKDPMIIVLMIAAVLSGITSAYAHESYADVIIITVVVLVNAILGMYQESKAEKAIDALRKMNASTAKVLRDQEIEVVLSELLCVGDVVVLEAGDAVPADGRLLESVSLKVEESALTGESNAVEKDRSYTAHTEVSLADRKNMVYMGSSVAYGRGKAVITAIGMDTEMGKIADVLNQTKDEETPLQSKLKQLSRMMSYAVLGICIFIFIVALWKNHDLHMSAILDTFMLAVSLAVAAIPEGLAAVVTVQLAIGVTKMSSRHAIIRQLTAVETLGCTQVICTDKTGTLTQNKMQVIEAHGEEALLKRAMALCNDAQLHKDHTIQGEPTEAALLAYAIQDNAQVIKNTERIDEIPFASLRKRMTTLHMEADGSYIQFTKGALDVLLKRCTRYIENEEIRELDDAKRQQILQENKQMAEQALRVLAAAYRHYPRKGDIPEKEHMEKDLIYIGCCGLMDPIREEVKAAMRECQSAGILPVMITGDHLDTAGAIARKLGLMNRQEQAISGSELDGMSDTQLQANIAQYRVYARVQPEHKVRIVDAWKARNMVVAMSGDGVNDAPSIKRADIGIGMGITGTDVTKNVADMVLADDNFATIVAAVEEGRRIYDNIRKAIQFLLSSNISEVLSIFLATLMGFTILQPVHILWVNLLTDTFPALALGMEEKEDDLMKRKPRPKEEGLFANGMIPMILVQGVAISFITLAAYLIGHYMESGVWEITQSADGMTMAFLTMSMTEILHSFNVRSQQKSLLRHTKQNRYLLGSMLASLVLTVLVIYVPILREMFSFEHISLAEFAVSILMASLILPIVELQKLLLRRHQKSHQA